MVSVQETIQALENSLSPFSPEGVSDDELSSSVAAIRKSVARLVAANEDEQQAIEGMFSFLNEPMTDRKVYERVNGTEIDLCMSLIQKLSKLNDATQSAQIIQLLADVDFGGTIYKLYGALQRYRNVVCTLQYEERQCLIEYQKTLVSVREFSSTFESATPGMSTFITLLPFETIDECSQIIDDILDKTKEN